MLKNVDVFAEPQNTDFCADATFKALMVMVASVTLHLIGCVDANNIANKNDQSHATT